MTAGYSLATTAACEARASSPVAWKSQEKVA